VTGRISNTTVCCAGRYNPTRPQQEFHFEKGNRIGKRARALFQGGVEIESNSMVEIKRASIEPGANVIYEATIKSREILTMANPGKSYGRDAPVA
jgi:hypothetical protein